MLSEYAERCSHMNVLAFTNPLILLITSLGMGMLILHTHLRRAEQSRFHLLSVALLTGMPTVSLILILLGLARLPVAWWILLPFALLGYWQGWKALQGKEVIRKGDHVWLIAWIISIGMFILMLYGSMQYPWLEDGDPWEHALTAQYVHDTKQILKPAGMYIAHYLPPYPPGMAVLEGAFWLTGSLIIWLKVFISLIIALMYPAFAFLLRRLGMRDMQIIASLAIAAMLPGVTHFIYAQQVALLFTLIALAWLPAAVRKGFWLPYALSAAAVLVTQQITSIFLITSSILLYGFLIWEGTWRTSLISTQNEKDRLKKDEKEDEAYEEEDDQTGEENMRKERRAVGKTNERRGEEKEGNDETKERKKEETHGKEGETESVSRTAHATHEAHMKQEEKNGREENGEDEKRNTQTGEGNRQEETAHDGINGKGGIERREDGEKRGKEESGEGRRKKEGKKRKEAHPFTRLARITLAFTLTIIILAGSFYAVMFNEYGKQGVFGTYGISEKDSDSVWWHYIHPPEKRCAASLISIDPSCKYPYYTLNDFWRTSSANSIDAGKGLGQASVVYALIGIILILFIRRRVLPEGFLLAWLLLTLLGVYGDALPVAFLPHRWWAFLTWPVAAIAGIGLAWMSRSMSTLFPQPRKTAWIILLILLLPAWTTSMQPKIGLNTAVWPPHGYPTGLEYAAWMEKHTPVGYLALTHNTPHTIATLRMADICSNTHSLLAGSGMRVPSTAPPIPAYTNTPRQDYYMWDIKNPKGKAWQLNTSNLSKKLQAYAAAYHVNAFTISTSCLRQAQQANMSFEKYTSSIITQLINNGWQSIWQDQEILILTPPR